MLRNAREATSAQYNQENAHYTGEARLCFCKDTCKGSVCFFMSLVAIDIRNAVFLAQTGDPITSGGAQPGV